MCELGFCSIWRPHTDRQRVREINKGREDTETLSKKEQRKSEIKRRREMLLTGSRCTFLSVGHHEYVCYHFLKKGFKTAETNVPSL